MRELSPQAFDALTESQQVRHLANLGLRDLPSGDATDESRRCLNEISAMLDEDNPLRGSAAPIPTRHAALAFDATAELECLAMRLRKDLGDESLEAIDYSLRMQMISAVKRICRLNSIAMSAITCDGRDFDDMHFEMHGEPAREVSHA